MTTKTDPRTANSPVIDLGYYLVWYSREDVDLCNLLTRSGVRREAARYWAERALGREEDFTIITRTGGLRAILVENDGHVWTAWEFQLDEPYDSDWGALDAGEASDREAKARGGPAPRWTVLAMEH